jgi:hypothetical protein
LHTQLRTQLNTQLFKEVFLGFAGWVPFWVLSYPSGGGFCSSYKAQKNAQKGRIY